MRQKLTCPYCHKPFTQDVSEFENIAPLLPEQQKSKLENIGFWATDLGLSVGLGCWTWLFCWYYDYSPLWSVGTSLLVGAGLPIFRLVLDRPVIHQEKPVKNLVSVEITEHNRSHYALIRDDFRYGIELNDLIRLAHAKSFSRNGAVKAGLTQSKWHYIKEEFLRMHLCVPAPNNANKYVLTLSGQKLMKKLSTSLSNNEERSN